jgi:hypothetical protein
VYQPRIVQVLGIKYRLGVWSLYSGADGGASSGEDPDLKREVRENGFNIEE